MNYFNDTCYLCLVRNENIKSVLLQDNDGIIIEEKLKYILSELENFKLTVPKNICTDCLNDLNYVYKFKQKCLKNVRDLSIYLEKQTTEDSSSLFVSTGEQCDNIKGSNEMETVENEQGDIDGHGATDKLYKLLFDDTQVQNFQEVMVKEESVHSEIDIKCDPLLFDESNDYSGTECQNETTDKFSMINSVENLLQKPFSRRTLEEKMEIKALGRPTPDLKIMQSSVSKNTPFQRKFNKNIYEDTPWLCGCPVKNALYCFPCILFIGGERSWSKVGVTNLGHIKEYIRRHNENKKHMSNMIDLANLGKVNIATQLDTSYRLNIQMHNEQVEKNRYILSKIIDCVKFCGAFELALREHDESDSSSNPGIFRGLIDLMSGVDNEIKNHIESNSSFKETSKTIQNELLDCMLDVCREEIKKQLKETTYIDIMADDTTDISEKAQTVLIFRYEYLGKIYERFWGFFNPPAQNADAIAGCLLNEIQPVINNKEKIIAQSYDGAAVMSGKNNGVQAKIKKIFPNAHFTHCYAHQLNSIMTQCASQNQSARVFLCSLTGIPAFFSHSPLRLAALEEVIARRIPRGTRLSFKSRVVNVIFENKEVLIECFLELEKSSTHSAITVREARALRHYLEDKDFNFWLSFFYKIMPHVDIFCSQIKSHQTNAVYISKAIESFISFVENVRNEYVDKSEETTNASSCKRRAKSHNLVADANKVCDLIIAQAKDRFQFVEHFEVAKLLESSKFLYYCKKFPDTELNTAVNTYPFLNLKRLKTQLQILYDRKDFRNIDGLLPLLNLLLDNKLDSTFGELTKLLRILITTPITTSEAERCFSTLKKIKSFLRNTMLQNRLNSLAMLSIEKELVKSIPDFNTRVIEKFVLQTERRMDFDYRK